MIVQEAKQSFLTGQSNVDNKVGSGVTASDLQTMADQSPAFFSEVVPSAFRLYNDVGSVMVSKATSHVFDYKDLDYYPSEDLGEFKGTPYEEDLLRARSAGHMDALKLDITRELKDADILERGSGETLASLAAGILSPTTLLPAGSIYKTAKGINIAKSAKSGATMGVVATGLSESALQLTQQTKEAEESVAVIAGGAILGGLLGAGVSALSRNEFKALSEKLEKDLTKPANNLEGTTDPLTNGITAGDLSSAAAEKLTLDDLTLKGKATQAVSNASRIINPFNRLINSPFVSVRETFVRMAEIPLKLNMNAQGKTLGVAVETDIKLYNKGLANSVESIGREFTALKKTEKQLGLQPTTLKDFKERVSYAMRNNDADAQGSAEITRVAQTIRKEVFDPLKQEAIDLGIFPADVKSKFADTYLTRKWSKDKLLMNREQAIAMFEGWAKRKTDDYATKLNTKIKVAKNADKVENLKRELNAIRNLSNDGFDEYTKAMAQEIYEKMTSIGDNAVPDFLVPVTRGPLKEKLLDIEDNIAAPFLENDIAAIIQSYTHQVGAQVAFTRQFGTATLEKQFDSINVEYQDAVKAAGDNEKLVKKLTKDYRSNVKDLENVRDLLRGTFAKSKDPDGMLAQAGVALADIQFMSKLGGVTVSSLNDIFRHGMVNGIDRAFGDLVSKIKVPKEFANLQAKELRDLHFDLEVALATRTNSIADIADPYARGSRLTRVTGQLAQGFSRLTLINLWNNIGKDFAALSTQRRILDTLTGSMKVGAKEREYLAYLGIDDNVAKTILEQYKKHGRKESGSYLSGIAKWDETSAVNHAARVYKAALRKEADTIVVTKGVSEVPIAANSAMGKLIFQFKSFLLSSHQRVLMRGMQDLDVQTGMGMMTMFAGGMMVAAIKKAERDLSNEIAGRKEQEDIAEWTKAKWVAEGLDRSGLFGVFWEANNVFEKAGGYGVTQALGAQPASRFASRNIAGAIFGPTIGTAADMTSIIGVASSPLTGKEVYKSDIKAIRNIVLLQNLIGAKFFFDIVEGKATEGLKGQ